MSAERRVLRYTVPVDDEWHRIDFDGYIVHVASRDPHFAEFWVTEAVVILHNQGVASYEAAKPDQRAWEFCVFGTGHPVDDGMYVGTALTLGGQLVWHLFKREVSP